MALTGLLNRGLSGDSAAGARAFEQVYGELRQSARRQIRRSGGPMTLTPTALVSEVYLKLREGAAPEVADRLHFYALAARAMRQILLDHHRNRGAIKRGSDAVHVEWDTGALAGNAPAGLLDLDYLALDQALQAFRHIDSRAAQVVELHFYVGLNFLEIAELLGISDKTARRDWDSARAYLLLMLENR